MSEYRLHGPDDGQITHVFIKCGLCNASSVPSSNLRALRGILVKQGWKMTALGEFCPTCRKDDQIVGLRSRNHWYE